MSYPWFQHDVNASQSPIVSSVESRFGLSGYAQFFKIMEVIGLQTKDLDEVTAAELSLSRWCTTLGCKTNRLFEFLDHLKNLGEISVIQSENILRIEMPKFKKLLEKRSKGAKWNSLVTLSGNDEREEENVEDIEETEEMQTDRSTSSTDIFWECLNELLSSREKDLPKRIHDLVYRYVINDGPQNGFLKSLDKAISARFTRSESAIAYGQDILAQAKKAYRVSSARYELVKEKREKDRLEALWSTSPHKTDSSCEKTRSIISNGAFDEIDLEDVDYFIAKVMDHFGNESFVKEKFAAVFKAREQIELTADRKNCDGKAISSFSSCDDDDDDDDDDVSAMH